MAGMGNSRHLEKGSTRPAPPAKDVLRVYGMKFCPFVHKLKLVLAAKGIEHETVNINLTKKPDWYFEINPRGTVPAIEMNGEILYESDITSNYVDEVFDGKKLTTKDPLKRAREHIILGNFNNIISAFFGILRPTSTDKAKEEAQKKLAENLKIVQSFLNDGDKSYFCGDQPGMTDYMVWPIVQRVCLMTPEVIEDYPELKKYIDRMNKNEAVIACRHSDELYKQYFKGYFSGNPQYDIGTVTD